MQQMGDGSVPGVVGGTGGMGGIRGGALGAWARLSDKWDCLQAVWAPTGRLLLLLLRPVEPAGGATRMRFLQPAPASAQT